MVAPTVIGLIVLNLWPFVQTLYTSFCEHLGFGNYKFVGLANFASIFQRPEFWKATWNTIYFCILTVPIGLFLSLLVAMLLNAKIKFKGGFRTIFFLPMVCAPAAVTMVWRWIFNGEYGILNQALGTHVGWITDPNVVMISCAVVAIWSNIGYDAVLLLAGLQNIPKTLYEANSIDGAGKVRQFFTITLPMVSPTLFVVMIMRLMSAVKVYDLIYMMVEDTNPTVTSVQSLMYLFYRESFIAGSRGTGSAIVIWTVLLIGLITVIQFYGQKKWVNYDV
nr:sugar ABC transporter permease [uncultured Oscillibacter sp.]